MKAFVIASLFISCAVTQLQGIPPFLIGELPEVIEEFRQLLSSIEERTGREVEQIIELWIDRQNMKIQTAFRDFKLKAIMAQRQAEAQHKEAVAQLSPEAKKADALLSSISNSASLTIKQKKMKIQSTLDSFSALPEAIKQELQRTMQG